MTQKVSSMCLDVTAYASGWWPEGRIVRRSILDRRLEGIQADYRRKSRDCAHGERVS